VGCSTTCGCSFFFYEMAKGECAGGRFGRSCLILKLLQLLADQFAFPSFSLASSFQSLPLPKIFTCNCGPVLKIVLVVLVVVSVA